jgi:tRNA nucleotidyltransferase/poly(A) polymerase
MDPENPRPNELEAPAILDRSRHRISRRDIDPDALKVLYRLSSHGFTAFLVGGAVRDMLLGRKPVDFDIGTNAHPNQIKKLFRNAFLIGRRFRLAHVKFQDGKTIEVSTFRRKPDEEELAAERAEQEAKRTREAARAEETGENSSAAPLDDQSAPIEPEGQAEPVAPEDDPTRAPSAESALGPGIVISAPRHGRPPLKPIAYGTPREDSFRRDLTINALFYDIATYSVIDYVGGLEDLEAGRVRIIGDPDTSYTEDPVRIWRVLRHASRLGFGIEEKTADAISRHRDKLAVCAGSRLFEELNKDMKSGNSRPFFQSARIHGVLPKILGAVGELYEASDDRFDKLTLLLGVLDASINSGGSPPSEVMYGLLLWPWAEPLLADIHGDKPIVLYNAFRASSSAALIPKSLLLETVNTLVIVDHMVQALVDGKMRWALKERPRYPEASRITSLLVEGSFGDCEDPFAMIYQRRFGARPRAHTRRRKRRPRKPGPPSTPLAPAA